jgi:hypothetical protein
VLPSAAVQEPLGFEMFAERVGQDFRIDVDLTTSIVTVLMSATSLGGDANPDADASRAGSGFSLVFRGPVEPLLPQRTYRFVHDELAALDIFIVPIGRDDAGVRYEAIFG